jgi:hypothetical protein
VLPEEKDKEIPPWLMSGQYKVPIALRLEEFKRARKQPLIEGL